MEIITITHLEYLYSAKYTASKVSKYGVFSGPYFVAFSPNTGKYEPEKTPYLDTFDAVIVKRTLSELTSEKKWKPKSQLTFQ